MFTSATIWLQETFFASQLLAETATQQSSSHCTNGLRQVHHRPAHHSSITDAYLHASGNGPEIGHAPGIASLQAHV